MEMGSKCVLGEAISVSGEVFLEDTTAGGLSTLAAIHKFEEGPLTEIWVQAKTAEHLETSLDGEGDAFLAEPHLLDPWSGEAA